MICAFTGHRPERLPWGRNEDDLRCAALKTLLRRTVREVYDRGFHTFLCGMARGCDQYFAEAVLAARADGAQDAQLCALDRKSTRLNSSHSTSSRMPSSA